MPSALRCHLLIGPPGCGKSTVASTLESLLRREGLQPVLLSTDRMRQELYGDAGIKGHWPVIEAALHQRLQDAVADDRPVIVDGTHARRSWRLALIQALPCAQPLEWIGWHLTTPLETSLLWNQQRQRRVEEAVLNSYARGIADDPFQPSRQEGFAVVEQLDPSTAEDLPSLLSSRLAGLDRRIQAARNKEPRQRHGYARLLDYERLLYLIRLLLRFPDLQASDPASRSQLKAIISPLPSGDLAERAAAFLAAEVGRCYADVEALRADLLWLEAQGFTERLPCSEPIQPPPPTAATLAHRGGWPPEADPLIFSRVMTLLRHLTQVPFDHSGKPLRQHLATVLSSIPGGYSERDGDNLRKDVERIFTPYGFRPRHDTPRTGYALGTAVLTAPQLQDMVQLLDGVVQQLSDPTRQELLLDLKERLWRGGLEVEAAQPLRRIANRSIVSTALVRSDCLAIEGNANRLEDAILAGHRVQLERYDSAARFDETPTGTQWLWPLQLVFHNIGWYLAYEEAPISQGDGLIRTERLDRLALRHIDRQSVLNGGHRSRSLKRLDQLLHVCGGIFFGDDLEAQLAVAGMAPGGASERQRYMSTLRFRCTATVFAFLREGLQRFPLSASRLSLPLPSDRWWRHKNAPHTLQPLPGSSHPYPVEIDLPTWSIERDVDLRRWLFGFGDEVIVEVPESLRSEHQDRAARISSLYS